MFLFRRGNIYYVEYLDPSTKKPKRVSTKQNSELKALEFAKSILPEKLSKDINFSATDELKVNAIDLNQFQDEYCRYAENLYSVKYVMSIKLSFREMLKIVGNRDLKHITTKEIDHFLIGKFRSSKHAAHLYLRTLKAAFNKAITWGYLEINPFIKIKIPKPPKNNPMFITESELELILSKTDNHDLSDIFKVAFFTGMRLGELTNLKARQVDLNNLLIRVSCDKNFQTKSKQERVIPLAKQIISIITDRVNSKQVYLFTKTGNIKYNEDYVSKKFKEAVYNTRLPDSIHFHTLRHSFASNLVRNGASLYIVKELLGHQSITTTQIYSHLSNQDLVEAINNYC